MLPEALPTSREVLSRTKEWRVATDAVRVRLAEPPRPPLPALGHVDAFAVEWEVVGGAESRR